MNIVVETTAVDDIPLISMVEEGAHHRPIVFYVHHYQGDKTLGVRLGYKLARAGTFFVTLDAYMHGERFDDRLAKINDPGTAVYPQGTEFDGFLLGIEEIVPRTARDIDSLIDHFAGDDRADASRVGVTGSSMGGWVTFYAAAHNPRISAAAPVIVSPGFAELWELVAVEASSYPKWANAMAELSEETARHLAELREVDPLPRLVNYAPKPLMMTIGDVDPFVPKQQVVRAYRDLLPLYSGHPDRLRLNIVDGVAHREEPWMMDDVSAWLAEQLCG